jgi:prevent-host-death family protein
MEKLTMIVIMTIMVISFEANMNKPFKPPKTHWSVAEAKARFSEVMDQSQHMGPQVITRNGKPKAVIVSIEQWEEAVALGRQSKPATQSLWQAAREAAGDGVELDIMRDKTWPKDAAF